MTVTLVEPGAHKRRVAPPVPPPLRDGVADARRAVGRLVGALGPSLGNVFLIPHPWLGMALWLALACSPRLAMFGLLGLGVAWTGLRALGLKPESGLAGGLKANALLASVAAGWLTAPTIYPLHVQVAIAVAAAASAFVVAAVIARCLRASEWPSLLWGYCLTAGAMFVLFPLGTMMAAQRLSWWRTPPADAPAWLGAFFRSIGSLLFSPTIEVGAAIVGAILLWSRAAFAAGVAGWLAGAAVALGVQSLGVPYHWLPAAHNFFVAGMALGALFILPGGASLPLAAIAGAAASLIDVALQSLLPALAYLPTASALAIWAGLGTLALAVDRRGFWRNHARRIAPEEAWWRAAAWAQRFGRNEPLLVVPVTGSVQVAQGFDGPLSHASRFRHALDFVRAPAGREPGTGCDVAVEDSIWNAPVFAPAAGVVERVRDGIADNPLGRSNFADSWGNYVCIRLDQGGWVLLAHLRQGSIAVQPATRVEIGTHVGAVGNSGRSPLPHLHLHVQDGPHPGAATLPFRLANYRSSSDVWQPLQELTAAGVPAQGAVVAAAVADPAVHSLLGGLSPGSSIWTVETRGAIPRAFRERQGTASLQVEHRLDAEGRHCLECRDGILLSVLAPDAWRILEQRGASPFLRLLAHAAPSIPYAAQPGMSWSDLVPAPPGGWARRLALLSAPYRAQPFVHGRSTILGSGDDDALTFETMLSPRQAALPSRILCRFERVQGPVSLEASFDHGSVAYSLVAFTPGLPL
jgi:murein DD-endopeptidase MepM/ murein hydrolase activator NlpD